MWSAQKAGLKLPKPAESLASSEEQPFSSQGACGCLLLAFMLSQSRRTLSYEMFMELIAIVTSVARASTGDTAYRICRENDRVVGLEDVGERCQKLEWALRRKEV